ncbi:MAG: glutamate--tRNA ligase [Woeseia sp.]|nr:glutamate--tRNA ligase [Woeseia sp.]NNE59362.1 glutamate--tRNA ligase [Woeseia sp.]
MTVRTRFAPSPTGVLHLGSVRTALFSWLYARRFKGEFILRIEDTDKARSTQENVSAILEGISWLGLDVDDGPHHQSQRFVRYLEVAEKWLEQGKAYRCDCSRQKLEERRAAQIASGGKVGYDGRCRDRAISADAVDSVVRFKNPLEGQVVVEDAVRGEVVFENSQLDDLVIVRSDQTPTYNFCVVIDDSDMRISHVIRGDDHLNNTPRQINMLRALRVELPVYAHLPMILGPDGAKLSKRHGAVDIREYKEQGYLPEAMLNYLVRLGWSHGDQELFAVDEMIRLFDITDVNQSASSFNPEKLLWLNQQHIKTGNAAGVADQLVPYLVQAGLDPAKGPNPEDVVIAYRERAETLKEMAASARYCYEDFDAIDPKAAKKNLRPVVLEPLREVREKLSDLDDWSGEAIAAAIQEVAASFEINMGKLGQPIRVAVTGGAVSPPIDVTVQLVGKKRVLERLDAAITFIEERAAA